MIKRSIEMALRTLKTVASSSSDYLESSQSTERVVNAVLALAKAKNMDNEALMIEIGVCLLPFYKLGLNVGGDEWKGNPIKYIIMAGQNQKARLHEELSPAEIVINNEIFCGPACKVFRGEMRGRARCLN